MVGRDSPGDGDAGNNQQHFAAFGGTIGTGKLFGETINGNTKTRRPVMYQDVDEALA